MFLKTEKFVLKFYDLWEQFFSCNSLPYSTQYGRLNCFRKVYSTLLSNFFFGLQNNVMYIDNFLNCVKNMQIRDI